MSDGTAIEWTDATWNPITGCSVKSPGCTNCYAMKLAGSTRPIGQHPSRIGLTKPSKAGPVWTGEVRFNDQWLTQPLHWRKPRKIFVCAHGDLFHENVPDEWIDKIFAVMALSPQHTFQVLTKRSARMRDYLDRLRERSVDWINAALVHIDGYCESAQSVAGAGFPLPNVWLGVSVEDQARADERIPDLLATPAAVRFISAEPLLGPVDLGQLQHGIPVNAWLTWLDAIDWVIAGGESGSGARPMHPDWARLLRDQCAAAGVAFHHKQNGEFAPGEIAGAFLNPEKAAKGMSLFDGRWDECWSEPDGHCDDEPDVYRIGKKRAGRLLDGVEHNAFPR